MNDKKTGFIYLRAPASVREEPGFGPEAAEGMTIEKVREYCKKVLTLSDKLLKKVAEYYRSNNLTMDKQVTEAYESVKKSAGQLMKYLKGFESSRPLSSLEESEQDTIGKVLAELRQTLATVARSSTQYVETLRHDPSSASLIGAAQFDSFGQELSGYLAELETVDPIHEKAAPKAETDASKKTETPKKSGSDDEPAQKDGQKKEKPRNQVEDFILGNMNNVIGLILQTQKEGKQPRELTKEEQRAVMLYLNPQETRPFKYTEDGKTTDITIERDWSGYYLRILGFPVESGNPFIAIWKKDVAPKWGKLTAADIETQKLDARLHKFNQKLEWLTAKSTPAGSRIFIKSNGSVTEVIKQADGSFRVVTRGEAVEGKPPVVKSKVLLDVAAVAANIPAAIDDKAVIESQSASEAQKVAEEKTREAAEQERLQATLSKLAEGLIQAHIFGQETKPFKERLSKMQAAIKTNGVTEWLSPSSTTLGGFRVRIHDARIALIRKIDSTNPEDQRNRYRMVASWEAEETGKTATA